MHNAIFIEEPLYKNSINGTIRQISVLTTNHIIAFPSWKFIHQFIILKIHIIIAINNGIKHKILFFILVSPNSINLIQK